MKTKIELTIEEVNQALRVLEELPIKFIGVAQYVTNYFTEKFKEQSDGDTNDTNGQDSSEQSVSTDSVPSSETSV